MMMIRFLRSELCDGNKMNPKPLFWRPLLPLLLLMVSCATSPAEPPSALQLEGSRATIIVVAPFNIALPLAAELTSSTQLVSNALVEHIEDQGKKVHQVEMDVGKTLWVESTREVVSSGGAKNFETAVRVFARKVRQRIDFDAIIIPALYIQNANTNFEVAVWDSANQQVEYEGRSRQEIEMPPPMTIPAASLLVYVLDAEGKLIHSRRTGLELIQHMAIHVEKKQGYDKRTWALKDDDPPIESEVRVRAAVAHALYPYLPK
jgi:hypothetical protein